jgi:heme oxygenase (mycobilin-producing)
MISVANRIFVNPDYAEAFEERFQNRARMVDTMPGFLFNQVLRPSAPGQPYIVLTYWDSYADFEAWTSSEAFREGHAKSSTLPKEAFSGRNVLEIHQVIQDSRDPELVAEAPLKLENPH